LLNIFPEDHVNKEGVPFWSGPKRAPSPIAFNPNDELHIHFVTACSNLIAFSLGIPQVRDPIAVTQIAAMVKTEAYVPRTIKVELPGEENKAANEAAKNEVAPEDEVVLAELLSQLNVSDLGINAKDYVIAEFEKDDDSNYHIDFIHATANLRARN
jgi:ubiquitin-activating enzyme E1